MKLINFYIVNRFIGRAKVGKDIYQNLLDIDGCTEETFRHMVSTHTIELAPAFKPFKIAESSIHWYPGNKVLGLRKEKEKYINFRRRLYRGRVYVILLEPRTFGRVSLPSKVLKIGEYCNLYLEKPIVINNINPEAFLKEWITQNPWNNTTISYASLDVPLLPGDPIPVRGRR